MRKTNRWMKLLLILPILLLAVLTAGIGWDMWKGNEKPGYALATEAWVSDSETHSADSAQTEETTTEETEILQEPALVVNSQTEASSEQEDPVVTMVFAGDIYLSDHVLAAYDQAGGMGGVLDEAYRQVIADSHMFIANQEFPFSTRGEKAPDKQYTFRLPPERVSIMNEIGADLVSLANNHSMDYGVDALLDTCQILDEAGILHVGAGADINQAKKLEIIEAEGKKIGFLGASRVYPDVSWMAWENHPGMMSGYDPTVLLEQIQAAKEQCDYVVVYIHWGVERSEIPEEYQRELGYKMIDAGADLVVGSHPHVLQGIEYYNGKPIVYSLGNFIFGSSIPRTALLKVDVDFEKGTASLSLIPGTSKAGYTRTVTEPEVLQEFYNYVQSISFGITVDEKGVVQGA